MLGVAVLIIVMSVMNGFRTDLTNKIIGFNPHIIVKPYVDSIDVNFKSKLQSINQNFKITDSFNGEAVVMTNDYVKGIYIKGIDNENDLQPFKKSLIEGDFRNLKKGKIVLGKQLAINLDVVVGDNINLMSSALINTPLGGVPKQEIFQIIGIFSSGFYEFDQNIVFLTLEDTLSFFDKTEKDQILEIYLKDPLKADFYKKDIEMISENFYVYSWSDLNKSFFGALKVERNVMFVILTLIIIVAAFNIISGLTILIKNKTKEIAILKTLGLSNLSITKSFFLTGFTIGFFASIAGVFLGVVFSFYLEEIRFFISTTFNLEIFPPDVYFLDKMPSEINPTSIFIIFIFSIIVTALTSFFPARAISKMDTIRGLKYE